MQILVSIGSVYQRENFSKLKNFMSNVFPVNLRTYFYDRKLEKVEVYLCKNHTVCCLNIKTLTCIGSGCASQIFAIKMLGLNFR